MWRKWQPKGNLGFAELPPEAQNVLLSELIKVVRFELGKHFIQGEYADGDDDKLFNGIIYRMKNDEDVLQARTSAATMIGRLYLLRKKIPVTMRANPGLRILMSIADFDTYDDELTNKTVKGVDYTDISQRRYKGITLEPLANWPDDLLVATICGMDYNTNLWAAVNLQDDMDVIQIDKLTNAGERYFFKMLMKADTNIAFGEEVIMLEYADPAITATPSPVVIAAAWEEVEVVIDATEEYKVTGAPAWATVEQTATGLLVTASANAGAARNATLTLTLVESTGTSISLTLQQGAGS